MNYEQYKSHLPALKFGKRLNNALYVYAESLFTSNEILSSFLSEIKEKISINTDFNVKSASEHSTQTFLITDLRNISSYCISKNVMQPLIIPAGTNGKNTPGNFGRKSGLMRQ